MAKNYMFDDIDKEKHVAISSKGGKASGKKRKEIKEMRELAIWFLETKVDPKYHNNEEAVKFIENKLTYGEAIILAQLDKAIKGDTTAATFVRDTSGQKPTDKVEQHHSGELTIEAYLSKVVSDSEY